MQIKCEHVESSTSRQTGKNDREGKKWLLLLKYEVCSTMNITRSKELKMHHTRFSFSLITILKIIQKQRRKPEKGFDVFSIVLLSFEHSKGF